MIFLVSSRKIAGWKGANRNSSDANVHNRVRGQLPGAQRVINSLAREWLNHTSRVSDEKKIFVSWRNSRAGERCDGAPRLILRKTKLLLGPTAQSRHL
ncbi:MAG: hypothetical protein DME36_02380 [Verrucomicrobia bacterium]|nr:MAG: hypothetical protein DME36_02380 [Verrucomicrobiota bacterium]